MRGGFWRCFGSTQSVIDRSAMSSGRITGGPRRLGHGPAKLMGHTHLAALRSAAFLPASHCLAPRQPYAGYRMGKLIAHQESVLYRAFGMRDQFDVRLLCEHDDTLKVAR